MTKRKNKKIPLLVKDFTDEQVDWRKGVFALLPFMDPGTDLLKALIYTR
jgi:hypothetical protein